MGLKGGERSSRCMPIVKLFSGEEFICEILEDRDLELVIEDFSNPKRVIPKKDIFSIDL